MYVYHHHLLCYYYISCFVGVYSQIKADPIAKNIQLPLKYSCSAQLFPNVNVIYETW